MAIGNYRFKIEIDGLQVGGFAEITGFSTTMETLTYDEGGLNAYAQIFTTGYKHDNLVLKKGFLDKSILDWYQKAKIGQIIRKSGSVILFDNSNKELVRWNFNDAFPVKFQSDPYSAITSQISMESIEIVHSGLNIPMDSDSKKVQKGSDSAGTAQQKDKKDLQKEKEEKKKSSMFGLLDALEDVVDETFSVCGLDYELTKNKLTNETFANLDTSKITGNFAAVAIKGIVNGDSPSDIAKNSSNALVDNIKDMAEEKIGEVTTAASAGLKAYNEGKSLDQVAGEMAGAYTEKRMENMGYPPYACRIGGAGAKAGAVSLANGDSPAEAKAAAYGAMAGQGLKEMGMDDEKADLIGKGTEMAVKSKKVRGRRRQTLKRKIKRVNQRQKTTPKRMLMRK